MKHFGISTSSLPPTHHLGGDTDRLARYEAFSRVRLSRNFYMRDFLFSTFSNALGVPNFPDNPEQVIRAGKALCERVLEPVGAQFGRFLITYGYQSSTCMEAVYPGATQLDRRASNPHDWGRSTFGEEPYARVDILPLCVEDKEISKRDFGRWVMFNTDCDLLMQWSRSNAFCLTISPKPRRVWLEWKRTRQGTVRNELMGRDFWQHEYVHLSADERPKFGPSFTGGSMSWSNRLYSGPKDA